MKAETAPGSASQQGRGFARHWPLDPSVTYLNHGGYGACPWPVLHAQSEWRTRMEREPVKFLAHELEGLLDLARGRLGAFVGADPDDLAFVPNATTGVNTVLRSLEFRPGDEILTTDHDYNACINAIREVAGRAGAQTVIAKVPFPVSSPNEVVEAILERAGRRTRLAVIGHVTSPTALVFPIAEIVARLGERGIDTLVDGAHAPGMLPLDVDALGAAYYAANCHKWLCSPKGAGFLHVRRDRQAGIRPLVTSHGTNSPRLDRSRFRLEFDWIGTLDSSAYLSISAAIDFMDALLPGGWQQMMEANRKMLMIGRAVVAGAVNTSPVTPESMLGSMAAIELPIDLPPIPTEVAANAPVGSTYPLDPLHDELIDRHSIEVPVFTWPHTPTPGTPPCRLVRISAQVYNEPADYERLARVLSDLTATEVH